MSTSDPTPETHFEAWGQAVYKAYRTKDNSSGLCVLFAISETSRQWLAWYSYQDMNYIDLVLARAPHEVLGEGTAFESHFSKDKPMRVDELCGSYMYSRGGLNAATTRTAVLAPGHHHRGSNVINLSVAIQSDHNVTTQVPADHPINLYIKRKQGEFVLDRFQFGSVGFLMTEPFRYPTPHLNVTKRLRTFEYNLTR
jgi:hypothetical protein